MIDIENLERDEDSVYYTVRPGKKLFVAKINSARKFMMAIPISCNGKLVGGITFDFTGEEFNDNEEFAKSKCTSLGIPMFEHSMPAINYVMNMET